MKVAQKDSAKNNLKDSNLDLNKLELNIKSEADVVTSSKRDENSLYTLTRKFIKMLIESPEKSINTKQAALSLQVAKRRIYDITNVLQGLGLISKWNVNSVKWIGGSADDILGENTNEGENDEELCEEERKLDEEMEEINSEILKISTDPNELKNAYVTYDDLREFRAFGNKLLFAVKAPEDTVVEYPKYEKGTYRMKATTEKGQISVFYVQNEK